MNEVADSSENEGRKSVCRACGKIKHPDALNENGFCFACSSGSSNRTAVNVSQNVFLTTESAIPNVEARLGVVSGQCVLGMNIFRDFTAEIRDVIGGRSGAYQLAIQEAKDTCMAEMEKDARHLGADAVVAVDIDFNEITGGGGLFGGKGMIMVVATGTAVKLTESPNIQSRGASPIVESLSQTVSSGQEPEPIKNYKGHEIFRSPDQPIFVVGERDFRSLAAAEKYINELVAKEQD